MLVKVTKKVVNVSESFLMMVLLLQREEDMFSEFIGHDM
jgi:hypothetical protein